ncbi:hypothetical protein [Buttiauxella sp. A111]|uniref:hypothetical protein n=1 Tax=Buttiauxella sp. A111 TaxID=2563088 RepID=UPI0016085795|nr:hypothetical protein [Buttiauxella sp. A111]
MMNFPLQTISASTLNAASGPIPAANFTVQIQCNEATDISIAFSDAYDPLNNTDILSASAESTARRAGLQLSSLSKGVITLEAGYKPRFSGGERVNQYPDIGGVGV